MPRVKRTKVYKFDELKDERAKDKARGWYRQGALDYDWWEFIYDDAERIGLKITAFELYRRKHAEGHLTMCLLDSINAILAEHGKDCDTYKLATETQERLNEIMVVRNLESNEDEDERVDDAIEELTDEYTKELLECYAQTLQDECDYRLSDEAIEEDIRANGYEFTKEGKIA